MERESAQKQESMRLFLTVSNRGRVHGPDTRGIDIRRISLVPRLRSCDFDLERPPHGWGRFRTEHDKTGHEQWVPLTETARKPVTARLEGDAVEAGDWLFPADRDDGDEQEAP